MKIFIMIFSAITLIFTFVGCSNNKTPASDLSASSEIGIKKELHTNDAFNEKEMVTLGGTTISAEESYADCGKEIGASISYSGFMKELREKEVLGESFIPPHQVDISYFSSAYKNKQEQYKDNFSEDEIKTFYADLRQEVIDIAGVFRAGGDETDDTQDSFDYFKEKYAIVDKLVEYDGNIYYFGYNKDFSTKTLTDDESKELNSMVDEMDTLKENIIIYRGR